MAVSTTPTVGEVYEFTPDGVRVDITAVHADADLPWVELRNVRTGRKGWGTVPSFRQGGHYVLVGKAGA